MLPYGFIRVAAAVPVLRLADPGENARRTINLLRRTDDADVCVVVFPELGLTGYTCADLFQHDTLRRAAVEGLERLVRASNDVRALVAVGLPLVVDDQLFNVAALVHRGRLLGVVPKSFLPNYKEFYERRWFAPAANARSKTVSLFGQAVPFGSDLLFSASDDPRVTIGVEICEDLWLPTPPSSLQSLQGATLLLNLSASNEVIGKADYRRKLVENQSARCLAAYVYCSAGVGESTTDVVFGGHALVAENGVILEESRRFQREPALLVADVDVERLVGERLRTGSFGDAQREVTDSPFRRVAFSLGEWPVPAQLARVVDPSPFVPRQGERLRERCEEIFHTQVAGLARRLDHAGRMQPSLGVSGGLDSTLALLVACKTLDLLAMPRSSLLAFTMPGFGTTPRTLGNARDLMRHLGVSAREVDIRPLCLEQWRALGHRPFGIDLDGLDVHAFTERLARLPPARRHDLVFENVQARMRTNILMNAGFVVGTGDMSELALGWCTYNGDHASMYNPNVGIPKTLVRFLVKWAAENEFDGPARRTLEDIVETLISPELLPAAEGVPQSTESTIGPYDLHDFFLFHLVRYGFGPAKVAWLADRAFAGRFDPTTIRRWLREFTRRFFSSQFKRSFLPDGPKVGSVSLSPRGDWRMPSDAVADEWLTELAD
jgi:NAD+ synthase (glutamine-hydrolysing)